MIRFHQLQKGSRLTTFALLVLPTAGDTGWTRSSIQQENETASSDLSRSLVRLCGGGGGKHYLDGELSIANEPLPVTNVAHKWIPHP